MLPEQTNELTEQNIVDLLHHDPLSDTPVGSDAPSPAEPEAPPPPPVEAVPEQGQGPGTPDLASQLAAANARYEELSRRLEHQPPAQQQEPQGPQVPQYMFNLPPQLIQALAAEDPGVRGQAMTALLSAYGQTIHRTLMSAFEERIVQLQESVPRAIQSSRQVEQVTTAVKQDFYGSYPELDNPALYPSVMFMARQIMSERPDLTRGGWNSKLRDEIAKRVAGALGITLQPRGNGAVAPKLSPGGSRPSSTQPAGQQRHIDDLFN